MRLFVLRHGEAGMSMGPDADRRLTRLGIEQTKQILLTKQSALGSVTRIIASPYVRAQQTAALVAEQLSLPVETHPGITPDGGVDQLQFLCDAMPNDVPLFVSHQPLVGRFLEWLTAEPRGKYFMGTSCLAAFDTDVVAKGGGELLWLAQP